MDWNGNLRTTPFVPRPDNNSLSFFYNYNYDPYSVLEMKHPGMQTQNGGVEKNSYGNQQEKKKRLTTDQLESLESCFQEEIKLDPDRKMKLARELGLQPRQIAVWFQNRRARWKNKQLERLYDSLKQDFDLVSREKLRLQEEVLALRSILKEQVAKNPISTGYTEMSGEETVESTSIPSSSKAGRQTNQHMGDCTYVFNVDDYNNNNNNNSSVMPPYWTGLPTYP